MTRAFIASIAALLVGCAAPTPSKIPWPEATGTTPEPKVSVETPSVPAPRTAAVLRTVEPTAEPRKCAPLDQKITIRVAKAELVSVLRFIADEAQLNLVVDADVRGQVTADLRNVTVGAALDALMKSNGLDAVVDGCILSAQMR